MILECPIIMMNDVVMVVRFNNIEVQLPSIKKNVTSIRVAHEDGKYFIADDSYVVNKKSGNFSKRKNIKKTTIDESIISKMDCTVDDNTISNMDGVNHDVSSKIEDN